MDWKDFKKSVAEWNKKGLKDYLCPNYVFNKWVFYGCMFVMLLVALLIMNNHNWNFKNQLYFNCPNDSLGTDICKNPYYQDPSIFSEKVSPCPVDDKFFCESPFFMPGYSYGEKRGKDIEMFPLLALSIMGIGFCINHLLFNRRGKNNDKEDEKEFSE